MSPELNFPAERDKPRPFGLSSRNWVSKPKELYKAPELPTQVYDAALNNFARLSMSAALASPITK